MKKFLFSLFMIFGSLAMSAQADSLQQYTGKYKFPDGSAVSEINVTLENGVLSATSAIGNAQLKKTDTKDVFDIVEYSGTATFKRAEDGKVKTMRVQVQDIDMEGTRQEGSVPGYRQFLYKE